MQLARAVLLDLPLLIFARRAATNAECAWWARDQNAGCYACQMCGGYELDADPDAIARAFRVDSVQLDLPLDGWPSASLERFPRQRGLIVIARADANGEPQRSLGPARFGLIPAYARDLSAGNKLFNARGESVHERPVFRTAFLRRRCLVPVSAFYEWQRGAKGAERHVLRPRAGGLMALAGIWETRRLESGEKLASFAIITTEPNAAVAPLHPRMPVILDESAQQLWLALEADVDQLRAQLVPAPDSLLTAVPG